MTVEQSPLTCPTCGEEVPLDSDPFWTWKLAYYCSEKCARFASRNFRDYPSAL